MYTEFVFIGHMTHRMRECANERVYSFCKCICMSVCNCLCGCVCECVGDCACVYARAPVSILKRTSDKWPKSCKCVCSVRASARSQTRSMASGSSENPFPLSAPLSPRQRLPAARPSVRPSAIARRPRPRPSRKTFSFQSLGLSFPPFCVQRRLTPFAAVAASATTTTLIYTLQPSRFLRLACSRSFLHPLYANVYVFLSHFVSKIK